MTIVFDFAANITPKQGLLLSLIGGVSALWVWRALSVQKKQLPTPTMAGPEEVPIIGGSYVFTKAILGGQVHEWHKLFPKQFGRIYLVSSLFRMHTVVHVCDADVAKRILTDNSSFRKNDLFERASIGILDYSLFLLSTSDLHRKHRKLIQPAFSPSHLRQVPAATIKMLNLLVPILDSKLDEKKMVEVNIDDVMMDITLDILGVVAFGKEFNAISSTEEERKQNVWLNLDDVTLSPLSVRPLFPSFLWRLVGISSKSPKILGARQKMLAFFRQLAEESQEKLASYNEEDDHKFTLNVLERLLLSLKQGLLSEEEVFGEMLGFFLAGHETSSHTLAFTLLELAKNPEVQSKLYEEVKNVDLSTDSSVSIEQLAHLKYLENTVKESQRMHPVVNALIRETTVETEMLGYKIPPNFKLLVNIMGIHNSPLYYEDPEKCNPSRWSAESLNPNAFLPFGMGSHQCIGMKLALIEIKILLIGLLQAFSVSLDPNHPPLHFSTKITHKPDNLRIRFHKR